MLPELQPIEEIVPGSPILSRPSWCDPSFMVAGNSYTLTRVNATAGARVMVAPANPRRWAIGFQVQTVNTMNVAPGANDLPNLFGDNVSLLLRESMYRIFDFGPMVCDQWFAFSGIGGTLFVYEILIA